MLIPVLVGAPGSGKSTVGRRVAALLGTAFVDTDDLVEKRLGRSVGDIFVLDGEPAFRTTEEAACRDALAAGGVVALGSGALPRLDPALLAGRLVVWLDVDVAHAAKRSGLDVARPAQLGNVRGMFLRMLRERASEYQAVADAKIDTSGLTPDEVAARVVALARGDAAL